MGDDIDTLSGEELAVAFYTEVLGEGRPRGDESGRVRVNGKTLSAGGCWYLLDGESRWYPVPLDGNQMMKGVRAMFAKNFDWHAGGMHGFLGQWATFTKYPAAPVIFDGHDDEMEVATARAALKAEFGKK
jgi:hypothetical protein